MRINELLKHDYEKGNYFCEDCFEVSYTDEDEEEFDVTENVLVYCDHCNKKTKDYPITKQTFNIIKDALEVDNE